MTATNHALVGGILGALLPLPVAIPLALASHFILDWIPHYGIPLKDRNHNRVYRLIVYSDALIALSMGVGLAILSNWRMALVGIIAYSPDIFWVLHYFKQGQNMHIKTKNKFMEFHRRIQHESPWGIIVELIIFVILFPVGASLALTT